MSLQLEFGFTDEGGNSETTEAGIIEFPKNKRVSNTLTRKALQIEPSTPEEIVQFNAEFDAYVNEAARLQAIHGPSHLHGRTIVITPAKARYLLNHRNQQNRPLNYSRVQRYVRIINAGEWVVHSQGMSFERMGALNNGQHRLHAIRMTGKAQEIYCVFGEDPQAKAVLDTGGARTAADVLAYQNIPNGTNIGAALRCLYTVQSDNPRSLRQVENTVIAGMAAQHDIRDSTLYAARVISALPSNPRPGLGVAHYLITKNSMYSPKKQAQFWNYLFTGTQTPDIMERCTVYRLRAAMVKRQFEKTSSPEFAAMVIIAWNAWIENRKVPYIWSEKTPFPIPK